MKVGLIVIIFVTFLMIGAPGVFAASRSSFNGASSAIQSAFVAVQTAGKDGGNTTALVTQLNGALALVTKASAENGSDPAQATADLQSAMKLAQSVQSTAATVAQQGTSARQFQFDLSTGSAVVIIGIAVALYLYGDRIYHRVWLRMYREQVVKKSG